MFTHYILGHYIHIYNQITINIMIILKWNSLWLPIKIPEFDQLNHLVWCEYIFYSLPWHRISRYILRSVNLAGTRIHTQTHNDLCMWHEKYLNINSINAAFEIERLTCKCINICGTYCSVWRAHCNDISLHLLSSCGHKPCSHKMQKVRIMWRLCDQQWFILLRWTYNNALDSLMLIITPFTKLHKTAVN